MVLPGRRITVWTDCTLQSRAPLQLWQLPFLERIRRDTLKLGSYYVRESVRNVGQLVNIESVPVGENGGSGPLFGGPLYAI
jgi:hypothetical protein